MLVRYNALIKDSTWDPNLLPEIAPHAGHKSGLSVLIDMKPSETDVESSISNDFNGVEVNVGAKHTFPRLATNNFLVSPGRVTMVEITGERIVTTEGYRALDVNDRNGRPSYDQL